MFRAAALVPSPPLLVPELTGDGASETSQVRVAALEVTGRLGRLASRWIVVGVGEHASTIPADARGSFRGYGVDVDAGLSPGADEDDPDLPLAALIAAWLRDSAAPDAIATAHLVGVDDSADDCRRSGRDLRRRMDSADDDWGVLVVADGATTLTPKAPGSFDDRAPEFQRAIDDALAAADVRAIEDIDRDLARELGAAGIAAWQVLAGIVGDDTITSSTAYLGAPFGVGYHVGMWEPVV